MPYHTPLPHHPDYTGPAVTVGINTTQQALVVANTPLGRMVSTGSSPTRADITALLEAGFDLSDLAAFRAGRVYQTSQDTRGAGEAERRHQRAFDLELSLRAAKQQQSGQGFYDASKAAR